jgi:NAD(P)-dependent dehydrogenase (short-subunit alcohol dehydrogenase family)
MFRLDGKIALVTGAATGLGQAIAAALTQSRANVALTDKTVDALTETESMIKQIPNAFETPTRLWRTSVHCFEQSANQIVGAGRELSSFCILPSSFLQVVTSCQSRRCREVISSIPKSKRRSRRRRRGLASFVPATISRMPVKGCSKSVWKGAFVHSIHRYQVNEKLPMAGTDP